MANTTRVAVVTGVSAGLGHATAMALAAQGWRIIGLGRDPQRCAETEAELRAASKSVPADVIRADLSLMSDAARAATEIAALTDRIDVLVNNAGGMAKKIVTTAEGNEENFAGNHLGPFLLTTRLLPLLRRAAADAPRGSVRIINTSSDASEMLPAFDFEDFQGFNNDIPGMAYCRGKLANVLFARGLAQKLAPDGIVAHAMHPGFVVSRFMERADEQTQAYMRNLENGQTPEEGADTLIWLATAEEPGQTTGGYFYKRAPRTPHPSIDDDACVARLWAESEKVVARSGV